MPVGEWIKLRWHADVRRTYEAEPPVTHYVLFIWNETTVTQWLLREQLRWDSCEGDKYTRYSPLYQIVKQRFDKFCLPWLLRQTMPNFQQWWSITTADPNFECAIRSRPGKCAENSPY